MLGAISGTLLIAASLLDKCETNKGGPTQLAQRIRRSWTTTFATATSDLWRIDESRSALQARVAPLPAQDALIVSTGATTVARPLE